MAFSYRFNFEWDEDTGTVTSLARGKCSDTYIFDVIYFPRSTTKYQVVYAKDELRAFQLVTKWIAGGAPYTAMDDYWTPDMGMCPQGIVSVRRKCRAQCAQETANG